MKKKIATIITNTTKEYSTGEKDTIRDNKTKGILKMTHQRRPTKNKRVPNQWLEYYQQTYNTS